MSEPVRYVLARAAENGFFEAVSIALKPFDPMQRGSIRRNAHKVFMQASTSTKLNDEAHILRLAFLIAGGRPTPGADDVEAVRQAFALEVVRYPRKTMTFWPVTFVTVAVLLLASAVTGFILWFPTPRERFAHSALGQAMSEGLTDWTVGTGRHDFAREEKGRDAVLTRGVKRQIGEDAFNLFGAALDQSKAFHAALTPADAEREQESLTTTLHSLDGALEAKKLPAFVDLYVDEGHTNLWLLGYYVEDRAIVNVGSALLPMVHGRRLDNLNLEVGARAYESKVLGGWVLSLDELDEWTILTVVPSLGKARGFAFGAEAAKEEGSAGRLASKVGERLRAELLPRAGFSEDDSTELANLLSQRHSAFIHLAVLGDELFEPRGLRASPRLKQALARRKDLEMDAREIQRIDDRVARFEKPFDKIVATQALIDEIRIASQVAADKIAFAPDPELHTAASAATAVASHLLMVARSETPYLALAEAVMGYGGYPTYWLIERELGLAPEWLGPRGVQDDAEYGQLGVAMFDKPGDVIRKAAESAYAKAFGAPMPAVSRMKPTR